MTRDDRAREEGRKQSRKKITIKGRIQNAEGITREEASEQKYREGSNG